MGLLADHPSSTRRTTEGAPPPQVLRGRDLWRSHAVVGTLSSLYFVYDPEAAMWIKPEYEIVDVSMEVTLYVFQR